MIKEINQSVTILKKMFKLNDIYFLVDDTNNAMDAQCIKVGFSRRGYNLFLYIGPGFVKGIAENDDEHLFEFVQKIIDNSVGTCVLKIVTLLYDNINKHVQTKLDASGSEQPVTTSDAERGEDL